MGLTMVETDARVLAAIARLLPLRPSKGPSGLPEEPAREKRACLCLPVLLIAGGLSLQDFTVPGVWCRDACDLVLDWNDPGNGFGGGAAEHRVPVFG